MTKHPDGAAADQGFLQRKEPVEVFTPMRLWLMDLLHLPGQPAWSGHSGLESDSPMTVPWRGQRKGQVGGTPSSTSWPALINRNIVTKPKVRVLFTCQANQNIRPRRRETHDEFRTRFQLAFCGWAWADAVRLGEADEWNVADAKLFPKCSSCLKAAFSA